MSRWLVALGLGLVAAVRVAGGAEAPEVIAERIAREVTDNLRAAAPWNRGPPELGAGAFPDYRFQRGDDPRCAEADFDDSAWPRIAATALPSRDGIYWVRWRVKQRGGNREQLRDGLIFKVVASYDLYWDGRLIGRNGRASAQARDEAPGMVDALFQIPRELLGEGEHVVALRMSSHHTGFPTPTYALNCAWGNFRTMIVERSRTALFSVMAVGAALVGAVVMGLVWRDGAGRCCC
jgi:hypothetical protein